MSKFLKNLFTFAAIGMAINIIAEMLDNVFSKDDGVIRKDSAKILSNSVDKDKIQKAVDRLRHEDSISQSEKVKLTTDETIQISL